MRQTSLILGLLAVLGCGGPAEQRAGQKPTGSANETGVGSATKTGVGSATQTGVGSATVTGTATATATETSTSSATNTGTVTNSATATGTSVVTDDEAMALVGAHCNSCHMAGTLSGLQGQATDARDQELAGLLQTMVSGFMPPGGIDQADQQQAAAWLSQHPQTSGGSTGGLPPVVPAE